MHGNPPMLPARMGIILNKTKNLNHRMALQIQKAHMVNALESFLSTVVNDFYAESIEAEFVVRLDSFEMSQYGVSSSAAHYSAYIYQWESNKNKIASEILDFDGGVALTKIFRISARNCLNDEHIIKTLQRSGLWKIKVAEIENFLYREGSRKLTRKIKEIQSAFGFHTEINEKPGRLRDNEQSQTNLLQCMSNITSSLKAD